MVSPANDNMARPSPRRRQRGRVTEAPAGMMSGRGVPLLAQARQPYDDADDYDYADY